MKLEKKRLYVHCKKNPVKKLKISSSWGASKKRQTNFL